MDNYKEKYNAALEIAKECLQDGTIPTIARDYILEIFPELKESEEEKNEKVRVGLIKAFNTVGTFKWGGLNVPDILAWLEKQGEQKHADKVVPKFHEGDWIILTAGELSTTLQIVNVDISKKVYWFNDNSYLPIVNEECLRHWTIQDAKDGDVLAEDSCIFIIQKLGDNSTAAKTYCALYNDGGFDDGSILYFNVDSTKPATKEQCDLLFRKMQEEGYTWDPSKKEAEKISTNTYVQIENQDERKDEYIDFF